MGCCKSQPGNVVDDFEVEKKSKASRLDQSAQSGSGYDVVQQPAVLNKSGKSVPPYGEDDGSEEGQRYGSIVGVGAELDGGVFAADEPEQTDIEKPDAGEAEPADAAVEPEVEAPAVAVTDGSLVAVPSAAKAVPEGVFSKRLAGVTGNFNLLAADAPKDERKTELQGMMIDFYTESFDGLPVREATDNSGETVVDSVFILNEARTEFKVGKKTFTLKELELICRGSPPLDTVLPSLPKEKTAQSVYLRTYKGQDALLIFEDEEAAKKMVAVLKVVKKLSDK